MFESVFILSFPTLSNAIFVLVGSDTRLKSLKYIVVFNKSVTCSETTSFKKSEVGYGLVVTKRRGI